VAVVSALPNGQLISAVLPLTTMPTGRIAEGDTNEIQGCMHERNDNVSFFDLANSRSFCRFSVICCLIDILRKNSRRQFCMEALVEKIVKVVNTPQQLQIAENLAERAKKQMHREDRLDVASIVQNGVGQILFHDAEDSNVLKRV
jgi:hypothetical protein